MRATGTGTVFRGIMELARFSLQCLATAAERNCGRRCAIADTLLSGTCFATFADAFCSVRKIRVTTL